MSAVPKTSHIEDGRTRGKPSDVESRRATRTEPRRRAASARDSEGRTIVSAADLRRWRHRITLAVTIGLALVVFAVIGVGPLLWLAKSAVSTTQDTLAHPLELWPSGIQWQNLSEAWNKLGIGLSTLDTAIMACGAMITSVLVATTGGFVLAILKPKYGRVIEAMILATLFIPGIVALVPLYLTAQQLGLIGTFWGVWLPAGAGAFNILIVEQFFKQIPTEVIDAARLDGANDLQLFVSIVLPMSKPIIGVVLLLSFIVSWKDFLWPLLALPEQSMQPLSVVLYNSAASAEPALLTAGMFIATIIPIVLFLIFQKQFLRSAGAAGALKG